MPTRQRRPVAPALVVLLMTGLGCSGAASRPAAPADRATPPAPEAARRERVHRSLRHRIDLASQPASYLLLDQAAGELRLMLHGVALETAAVTRLEVGRPRVIFVAGPSPDWQDLIWEGGRLTPARQTRGEPDPLPADPDGSAASAAIPPTAEDAIDVPPRYLIRFTGGLALEIQAEAADDTTAPRWRRGVVRLAARARDVAGAVAEDRDIVRLRLDLPADQAARLYRSLPADVRFLAVAIPLAIDTAGTETRVTPPERRAASRATARP